MTTVFRRLLLAIFLFGAAGCQTDISMYERPLIENKVLDTEPSRERYPYALASLSPQFLPNDSSLEAGLWMTVEKMELKAQTAGNRLNDQKLNEYLRSIMCRLAEDYCGDMRVYTMRVPAFNASMYPNGMMHVWTGLLLRAQNEAQVAAVLGHEIGHFLRRHSLQRMKSVIETTNALVFAQMALAVAGVPSGGDLLNLAAQAGLSAYSRDHEREADGYGLLLMAKGGYDPREASKIWERVIREKEADEKYRSPSIFAATHPASEERMKVLAELATRVKTEKGKEVGKDRFNSIILPLRATFLRDEIHRRQHKPTDALIDMLIEDGTNLSELYFFKGELQRVRNKKNDLRKALEAYKKSIDEGNPPSAVYRQIALVKRRLGDTDGAKVSLQTYLEKSPQAEDAEVIKQLIREMK